MSRKLSGATLAGAATAAALAAALAVAAGPAAAATTASVEAGTLDVTGDGASERLALRLAPGDPGTLQVDVGNDGTAELSFDRSTFTAIHVDAGGGDDEVVVDQVNGLFTDEAVTIDGGRGDDTLRGADGADVLIGGGGDDTVIGGRGADTAELGAGDDRFVWNPGDASDTVEGGGGRDQLDFNGSNAGEHMTLTADGAVVDLVRDVAAVTMALTDVDTVSVTTLGGADTVTVGDLTGTGTHTAAIDLGGSDAQADSVVVRETDRADGVRLSSEASALVVDGAGAETEVTGGEAAIDDVEVDALGGDDSFSAGAAVAGALPFVLDGGEGSDTVGYVGTPGADTITLSSLGTAVATTAPGAAPVETAAVESLQVSALGGDDTISAGNGLSPLTTLTLDGGDGNDTIRGGDGADVILGGSGDDVLAGGRGNDQARLGSGDDEFDWSPGDGSDGVDGQGGRDRLVFNGSNIGEHLALTAGSGPHTALTRDVGAVTMDLVNLAQVDINTLGGADTVEVGDLTGTGIKAVNVDLGANDAQADTVTVNGTARKDSVQVGRLGPAVAVTGLAAATTLSGSEATLDTLRVQTLDGRDTVAVAAGVADLIVPIVDLGIQ